MGGSSKSSSSSSNTTNNSTVNESLNASLSGDIDQGAIVAAGKTNQVQSVEMGGVALDGSNNTVTVTDQGAMQVLDNALAGMGGVFEAMLENQAEVLGGANALAGNAVANMTSASGADPVEFKKPMTEKTKIAIAVSAAVAAVGIAYAAKRGKK